MPESMSISSDCDRMQTMTDLTDQIQAFVRDRRANVAIVFSLAAPVVMALIGGSIDYVNISSAQVRLQALADQAAISGAQSTRVGGASAKSVTQAVNAVVAGGTNAGGISASTSVGAGLTSVTVRLDQDISTRFGAIAGYRSYHATAAATARISGGAPTCMVALASSDPTLAPGAAPMPDNDPKGTGILKLMISDLKSRSTAGVDLSKGAKVTASGCSVGSNLPKPYGLSVEDSSILSASQNFTAGGYIGKVGVNYLIPPVKDAVPISDPLAGLPQPSIGGCDFNDVQINGGSTSLTPGVYCGGLSIDRAANVTLMPGVYTIKDGPFIVEGGSTLTGNGVGFFLTMTVPTVTTFGRAPVRGRNSGNGLGGNLTSARSSFASYYSFSPNWKDNDYPSLYFGTDTHISLTAPTAGPMAGLLLFEDRAMPFGAMHVIVSNDTRNLLGTIYLSRGFLGIASSSPVADKSAYTIIVANAIGLYGGPELVLNTNFTGTAVPTPQGVGPNTGMVSLAQ